MSETRMEIAVTTNPTNSGSLLCSPEQLIRACGILVNWGIDAVSKGGDVVGSLGEMYGFPMPEMEGGKFGRDGTYHYPYDPSLPPLVLIDGENHSVYVYKYAMVAIHNKEDDVWYMTRMD